MRRCITLAAEADFTGFRQAARSLLREGVAPEAVDWAVAGGAAPTLFEGGQGDEAPAASVHTNAGPRVPAEFVTLCQSVALHHDAGRFALLYRLLWRLQHEAALRHDPLDAERARARHMAQAVRRDIHKMRAFVRFRPVAPHDGGAPLHVAWFEPEHHIVEANAPFFAGRFTALRWAILTPRRCVRWDGQALHFGPGAERRDAPPADAGEALWLTYYQSIFNPARLKLRAMEKEMPRRYWHNLPEAALISTLAAQAHARSAAMVERAPTVAERRLPAPPATMIAVHAPGSLSALRAAAANCRECPLGALATQTVWGEGPTRAALMVVGEQPGDQEDLQGKPFVGSAGQLFDRALAQLGWDRSLAYVTNAVKHFKYEPRGKRRIHKTPAQREADACQHWMESEIALVQPRAIVALGATAARQLLGRPVAVTRERGQWLQRADGLPVLITLHPSALLRMEAQERDAAFEAWLNDLALATKHVAPA